MHFRKLVFSVLAVLAIGQMASAQVKRCITPEIRDGEAFENWLSDVRSARSMQRLAAATYNIPVIVHIIHDGEAVGQGDNISLDQVISQFVVLNADFTRTNADASETPAEFLPVAAGMDISFVPAIVNETGDILAEPGVHRVNRNGLFDPPPYNSSYINGTIKPATIWDPDKYFNIWVLDFSEALGYAQPPVAALPDLDPSADANLDGIVVRSSAFGTLGSVSSPWNKGRVTTHEAGHWLGLYHLWGKSNDMACGEDDYVADTPNQDEPNQFCPSSQGPVCSGVTREMWENYMDYTYDQCMNLFTMGQVDRMTTVVENAPRRNTLLVSNTSGKFYQQITFSTLAESTYGDEAFELTAFSSSGLPVSYSSSDEAVATVTGSNVTIIGAGSTVITASQEGNFLFNEASFVQQTLVVNKADQIITFESIPTLTYNDPSIELIASSSSSLEVTFSSPDTTVSIAGTLLDILGAGEATITASHGGDNNYNAASVFQTIDILKADQTITFETIAQKTYGDPDFLLMAGTDSGLPGLYYESSDTTVLRVEETNASIARAGEVTIAALQQGNHNYNPTQVDQLLTINKAEQYISFEPLAQIRYLDTLQIEAVSNSGLSVSFLSDDSSKVRILNGNVLVSEGVGEVAITASQEGNENFSAAEDVIQAISMLKAFQTITINVAEPVYDTTNVVLVNASSSSGSLVILTTSGSINEEYIPTGAGMAEINASVPESGLFEAAENNYSFCILPVPQVTRQEDSLISNYAIGNFWFFDDDTVSVEQAFELSQNGNYTLIVNVDGCVSQSIYEDFVLANFNGILLENNILLYPNPARDRLFLKFNGNWFSGQFRISNIEGKQLNNLEEINLTTQKIDINHLIPGVYFLQLIVDERPFTIRFVKE